jgi:hypothetical protein
MLPLSARIFVAVKFWLPRPAELGRAITFQKVNPLTMAKYEIEKAKNLRNHLFKRLARR